MKSRRISFSRLAHRQVLHLFIVAVSLLCSNTISAAVPDRFIEMPSDVLADKIRGGMMGQLLGNLNGLAHEMRYIHEPGNVESYTPALPKGAWTDDDTDIEWVYVWAMEKSGQVQIPYKQVANLWRDHINSSIWCANLYARNLIELGIDPPLTGRIAINPWSEFNISGQFVCESFGLMAPCMPRTAARLGLHYTHVTIDGEPAQATQLFTAMIATAFHENDLQNILRAGLAATDPDSEIHQIVLTVRVFWQEQPHDWRDTRQKIKAQYSRHNGAMRDRNGYELNTASTIAALLYGRGDFAETLRLAFNFGWDADNNAATAATVIGVIKGWQWMQSQGWNIEDKYKNTTRNQMPDNETITAFADRVAALACKVILAGGGQEKTVNGKHNLRIRAESPANIERLPKPLDRRLELQRQLIPQIENDLSGQTVAQARAAYIALCLDEAGRLQDQRPEVWARAIKALSEFPNVVRAIFDAPGPSGAALQARAAAVGLKRPD